MHRLKIIAVSPSQRVGGELVVTNPGNPTNDEVIHRWVYSYPKDYLFVFRGGAAQAWARQFESQGRATQFEVDRN